MTDINEIQKNFLEECIKRRKERAVSLSEIADKLGYSVQTISKFERGENNSLRIGLYYATRFMISFYRMGGLTDGSEE